MAKLKEEEARKIYGQIAAFFHLVWYDENGKMKKRDPDMKLPKGWREDLAWLPYSFEWDDEKEDWYLEPIIDPMPFKDFCKKYKWRIVK